MLRYIVVCATLLATSPALAGQPTTWGAIKAQYRNAPVASAVAPQADAVLTPPPPRIGLDQPPAGGTEPPNYTGGVYSLPYGNYITSAQVLQSANAMDAVRVAIDGYLARGYIRRTGQDYAGADAMGAIAFLAFEKPGVVTSSRQPVIMVRTGPAGGDDYFTQVLGGVVKRLDASHCGFDGDATNPDDPAFAVYGYIEGTNAPAPYTVDTGIPYARGETWISVSQNFAAANAAGSATRYMTGHTPCYWGYLGAQIGVSTMTLLASPDLPCAVALGVVGTLLNNHISQNNLMGRGTDCP